MVDSTRVKLDSNLQEIADALPDMVAAVLERETLQTQRLAIQLAPIGETGNMARSSTASVSQGGNPIVGEVTFHAHYAAYVNFGTGSRGASSKVPDRGSGVRYTMGWVGMRAMPYLSTAAHEVNAELSAWARDIGDMIRQRFDLGSGGSV